MSRYDVKVGRPRVHDEETRATLRAAAERLVAEGGAWLSRCAPSQKGGNQHESRLRLFGSKEGLLVDALAQGAFEFLADGIDELVETDDPAADLVEVGVPVFRSLVLEHPALYRIAFQRVVPGFRRARKSPKRESARSLDSWRRCSECPTPACSASKTVRDAAVEFNSMLEGLANAELRGTTLSILPAGEEERAWREALTTVIRGFDSGASGSDRVRLPQLGDRSTPA